MKELRARRSLASALTLVAEATTLSVALWSTASAQAQAAEWKTGRLLVDTVLYAKPSESSAAVVRYPKGTVLKAYTPDRNGWITVYLPKPVNGTRYAWVPVKSLQLAGAPAPAAKTASTKTASPSSAELPLYTAWFGAGGMMVMASPSAYQTGIGETVKGLSMMNIDLEFGYHLNPKLYWLIRGGTFSFSQPETRVTGTDAVYSVNGTYLAFGMGYMFVRKPRFAVGFEGTGGVSVSSASDVYPGATNLQALVTSNILAFPLRAGLRGQARITGGLGANVIVGYELHTLSQVSSYLLTDGSTVTPDISLGGLLFGAHLIYSF